MAVLRTYPVEMEILRPPQANSECGFFCILKFSNFS